MAFLIGLIIGAGACWFYMGNQPAPARGASGASQPATGNGSAWDALQDRLRAWNLNSDTIKDELARTGRVIRQKADQAGHALADATADARITTAVKTKLVASRDLPGMAISVSTTEGIVTLSGAVPSADAISKAMLLALETDGVKQVISTLQVTRTHPGSS